MEYYELRAKLIKTFIELHSKVAQDKRLYKMVDWDKIKHNISEMDEQLKVLIKEERKKRTLIKEVL